MDAGAYTAGFAVQLALKDIDLAAQQARPSPLLQVVRDRLQRAPLTQDTAATTLPRSTSYARATDPATR